MIVTGAFTSQVAELALAWQLRADIFKRVNKQLPSLPTQKILFWLRVKNKSRGILNQEAMFAVADKYNLSYTYALFGVHVVSSCHPSPVILVICAHAVIFMPFAYVDFGLLTTLYRFTLLTGS